MSSKLWIVALMAVVGCRPPQPSSESVCASVPFPFRPTYGAVGERLAVTVPGGPAQHDCTATAVVQSPSGESQRVTLELVSVTSPAGEVSQESKLSLTPSTAGEWSVVVTWTGRGEQTQQTLKLPVFAWAQTGQTTTQVFPDRMDTCGGSVFGHAGVGLLRTSTLVLCERNDQRIWVYSASTGAYVTDFAGIELRVLGNEVWALAAPPTLQGGLVEHRTDIGGSLRLDAALPSGAPAKYHWTIEELDPGRYARSYFGGVEVFSWDGMSLSRQTTPPEVAGADTDLVLEPDGGTWSIGTGGHHLTCRIERGCQVASCAPVVTCPPLPPRSVFPTLVSHDALWGIGAVGVSQDPGGPANFRQVSFLMMPRPLELGVDFSTSIFFELPFGVPDVLPFAQAPTAPHYDTGKHVLLLHPDGNNIGFSVAPRRGPVLSVTRDWIITLGADAFTVTFTPRSP